MPLKRGGQAKQEANPLPTLRKQKQKLKAQVLLGKSVMLSLKTEGNALMHSKTVRIMSLPDNPNYRQNKYPEIK